MDKILTLKVIMDYRILGLWDGSANNIKALCDSHEALREQLAEAQNDVRELATAFNDALSEVHINLGCDPRCEELRHKVLMLPGVKRVMGE